MSSSSFAQRLVAWHRRHGRKDLPWQLQPDAYRIWVSEIMLQQTQVATVIPYFKRFMERFPDLEALSTAPLDAVLHLWSGLGYYARARNLHRAARLVQERHSGRIPEDIEPLAELPGIGRSTAGAILALSAGQRHAILDGNVRRVLTRFHAVEGWPGRPDIERYLWRLAEDHTPNRDVAVYTQAVMDLGATLCSRTRPACHQCPVCEDCLAHRQGDPQRYPTPRPRRGLPTRSTRMLVLCDQNDAVLLEQRPPAGLWGGLWSFPECPDGEDVADWSMRQLGCLIEDSEEWPLLHHTFTHFRLEISPVHARLKGLRPSVMERSDRLWYNIPNPQTIGLSAVVKRLLPRLSRVS